MNALFMIHVLLFYAWKNVLKQSFLLNNFYPNPQWEEWDWWRNVLTACAATDSMWSTLQCKTISSAWSSGGAARATPGEENRLPKARTVSKAVIRSQWLVTSSLLCQVAISVVFTWKEWKSHRGGMWDCTHLNVCQNILNLMTDGMRMLHSWGQRKEVMGLKSIGFHGQPV